MLIMARSVAVITISDTCFADPTKDISGPTLVPVLRQTFPKAFIHTKIVADEIEQIKKELVYYADELFADLILTTGGTGFSKRDVTPEATKSVIDREAPSISTALTLESLKATPMAMLSRAVSGIRNRTLIINLPGSKKAALECYETIKPVLHHAISLLRDDMAEIKAVHNEIQNNTGHVCPHSAVNVSKVALRPRESPYRMLPMSEALEIIERQMTKNCSVQLDLENAINFVIAEEICTKENFPPFPASIKDGYACISSDGAGVRHVQTVLMAGDAPITPLKTGECTRINTGAPLPPGADCVVQVEDTKLITASQDGCTELEVEIAVAPIYGQDVRAEGSDISIGMVLARPGDIIDPALIGVLASAGVTQVVVYDKPRVALLSTGNELQEPFEVLKPAHIRDSNRIMLQAMLKEYGFDSIDCGIVQDEVSKLKNVLSHAMNKADIIICTGGVSMGERDLLKPVLLGDFKATLHFGRVFMKPGKPSTFATCSYNGKKKYIFALPGNPVSAYVCCLLFVVPALRICSGHSRTDWPELQVKLAHSVKLDPRPEYVRAVLKSGKSYLEASVIGNQCSSRLLSAVNASVLLKLPPASTSSALSEGTIVTALVMGQLHIK